MENDNIKRLQLEKLASDQLESIKEKFEFRDIYKAWIDEWMGRSSQRVVTTGRNGIVMFSGAFKEEPVKEKEEAKPTTIKEYLNNKKEKHMQESKSTPRYSQVQANLFKDNTNGRYMGRITVKGKRVSKTGKYKEIRSWLRVIKNS